MLRFAHKPQKRKNHLRKSIIFNQGNINSLILSEEVNGPNYFQQVDQQYESSIEDSRPYDPENVLFVMTKGEKTQEDFNQFMDNMEKQSEKQNQCDPTTQFGGAENYFQNAQDQTPQEYKEEIKYLPHNNQDVQENKNPKIQGQKLPQNRYKNLGEMVVKEINKQKIPQLEKYLSEYNEKYKNDKIQKRINDNKQVQDGKKIQINHGKKFLQHIASYFPDFLNKFLEEKAFQQLRESQLLFRKTNEGKWGKPSEKQCEQYLPLFDYLISYHDCDCCKAKKKVKLT